MNLPVTKRFNRFVLIAVAFIFCFTEAYGHVSHDNRESANGVVYAEIPHVKIYLHTNKSNYVAGEHVWFKAYLTDYFRSVPDSVFSAIYVDLVNYEGKTIDMSVVEIKKGAGKGSILIPDSLLGGSYALRAYHTNPFPDNPSSRFQKVILIENPIEENFVRRSDRREVRRYNRLLEQKESRYDAGFYPESGKLVAGIVNKVVMRVTNELGQGVDFSALIKDSRGNKVAETRSQTEGFAEFFFQPMANTFYHAEIEIDGRRQGSSPLPDVVRQGYNMIVEHTDFGRNLVIQSNPGAQESGKNPGIHAVIHNQGALLGQQSIEFSSAGQYNLLLDDKIRHGLNIVSLTDSEGNLLAERMVYEYGFEFLRPEVKLLEIEKDDSLFLSVSISLDELEDTYGNFSLSITDMPAQQDVSHENLYSYLWLNSELEKPVVAPQIMLSREENKEIVDYMMIMASAMRYNTNQQLLGLNRNELMHLATGLALRGKVIPRGSNQPTGYTNVELAVNVEGDADIRTQQTNTNGAFVFDKLDYPGLIKVEVTPGVDVRGRKVMVEMETAPAPPVRINEQFRPREAPSRGDNWQRVSRPTIYTNASKVSGAPRPGTIYGNADNVIYVDDLPSHVSSVMDALRGRVPGFSVTDGQITMRGSSSINMSNEPIFVVDGNVVNSGSFLNMSVREFERIEIMKGASAAMFGSRGANGAIIGITRSGDQSLSPTFEFMVEGFSLPSDFLTSLYNESSMLKKNENFIHTHYWEPELIFDHEREKRISFPLFVETGRYFIVLEGVDAKGRILSLRKIVEVRK